MELGTRLKELRKANNLTQKELGDKIHLSRQTISKWETNNSQPDIQTLLLLANLYDCTLEELMGENKNFFVEKTTLPDSEKQQILAMNDDRRRDEMLTKNAKKFLSIAALLLLLVFGKILYDEYELSKSNLTLYGVAKVERTEERLMIGIKTCYVSRIVLKNGEVLDMPDYDDIEQSGILAKRRGEKGTIIGKGEVIGYYLPEE